MKHKVHEIDSCCSSGLDTQTVDQKTPPKTVEDMKRRKKKALLEFRIMVEDAILGNYLLGKQKEDISAIEVAKSVEQLKEISLWGVPLMPSKGHEGTDIVLLKFLKDKNFKVHDAFKMLRKTLKWRRAFLADVNVEEDLDPECQKIIYLRCKAIDGQPLYFNIYGHLKDQELYNKLLGTQSSCDKFIRMKIQLLEKSIQELSFKPDGPNSIVHITDLKNSPGPGQKEFALICKQSMMLFQNHYPDLVHRHIVLNVPFWYYVCHVMASKLITQRTKRRFVFARPSQITKTLLKYIAIENLPVEYGGFYRETSEFFPEDKASEVIVRKNTSGSIQIPVSEVGVTMTWDVAAVDWDVAYKEEFIPDDEGSYKVLMREERDRKGVESLTNSFHISEPGKIVITIDNSSFQKKRIFYRYKTKPTVVPMFILYNQ